MFSQHRRRSIAISSLISSLKVDGVWYLHLLDQYLNPDLLMVLFSVAGVIGNKDQDNSAAAADIFLDLLTHLRRAKCLAAT